VADPVAWKLIAPGWTVLDADGEEVGRIREVTGDADADIFDGLAIDRGRLSREQYVPSEHVGEIRDGTVELTLSRAEVESLGTFREPAAEERVLPESSTWYQRLAWWLTGRDR
jgi:hypothetical protein